jgi:hypothetical protein
MRSILATFIVIQLLAVGVVFSQEDSPPRHESQTGVARQDSDTVSDEEFRLPLDPTAAQSADELIPKLGSPSYKEREEATAGLIEIGAPAFGKLRVAYHSTNKLVVLLRIEWIVRTAYLNHHVYDRSGFLGINLQSYVANAEENPRLPAGSVGVKVGRVIENTAAERAGMLKDDVIFQVDSQPLRGEGAEVVETFSAMIRDRGPGGKMSLTVMRGNAEIPMQITIGRCPEEIARQGTVRAVSENHFKASARFPKWWDKYFLGPAGQAVGSQATPP